MAAEESLDSIAPFVCGLCSERFLELDQYYLHLKSHNAPINKWFHICGIPEESVDKAVYKCNLCACQFGSICTLHDHLTSCFNSGSYIFYHSKKTAYPLSKFCSFYEHREKIDFEEGDNLCADVGELCSSATETEERANDKQYSSLGKLVLDVLEEGRWRGAEKTSCDVGTDIPNFEVVEENICDTKSRRKNGKRKAESLKTKPCNKRTKVNAHVEKLSVQETTANGNEELVEATDYGCKTRSKTRSKSKLIVKQCKGKYSSLANKDQSELGKSKEIEPDKVTQTRRLDSESSQDDGKHLINKRGRHRKRQKVYSESRQLNTTVEADSIQVEVRKGLSAKKWNWKEKRLPLSNSEQVSLPATDNIYADKTVDIKADIESTSDVDNATYGDNLSVNGLPNFGMGSDLKEEGQSINNDLSENISSSKLRRLLRKTSNGMVKTLDTDNHASETQLTDQQNKVTEDKGDIIVIIKKKRGRKRADLLTCEICGKAVKKSKMRIHVVSHTDVRAFKCDCCPKTYKYQEHLTMHKKSHDDVLPFYCEVCGQGFVDANRLKRHTITHTDDRPYKCSVCEAGFVTKYKLDRHMFVHTGVKTMQCDLCGMQFAHKTNLSQHISGIHHKERRFPCTECDKSFFTNYQLKVHAMKHSGIRPFKCNLCKSDFIERKELRRHLRKLHSVTLEGEPTQDLANTVNNDNNTSEVVMVTNGITSSTSSPDKVTGESVLPSSSVIVTSDCLPQSDNLSLPVFITNLNQSDAAVSGSKQGTSQSISEQFQLCQPETTEAGNEQCQNCQSNRDSGNKQFQNCLSNREGSEQFQACQPSAMKEVHYDNQLLSASRHYDICGEQRDVPYGNMPFSDPDQRIYVPLYLAQQVKQQQGYEEIEIQVDAKGSVYGIVNTPEQKPAGVYGQMSTEQTKDQLTYQNLQAHGHSQENFTVL